MSFVLDLGAQEDFEKQKIIEKRIEFIGENLEDSDIDLTTYFDDFYYFIDNPVNLNTADFETLNRLHLLTDVQIQSIINYRLFYGDYLSIYELSAIEELDAEVIEMMLPFVAVKEVKKDDFKWKNAFKYGKHEVFLRYQRGLEEKTGYMDQPDSILLENPNKQYLGSADKIYARYRNQYKNRISWGITMEKDPGEELFGSSQPYGFDYYSAHLFMRDLWKFDAVALGDFQANFGQGLTMWSSFAMNKSANVLGGKRYAYGLKPYTSVNESQYLRGGGISMSSDKLQFTAFGSYKHIDANLNDVDSTDIFDNSFSSFQVSGYHRTPGEIEDKNVVGEAIVGGELAYRGEKLRIGLASVYTNYDQPLNADLKLYNQFKFNSNQLLTTGLNYRYFYRKMSFFGETAMSDNMKFATVNGIAWHADPKLDLLFVHRKYDKGFQSIYSNAFGESSDNTGEQGMYIGMLARISKRINFSAYYDQFNYTYLKWLTDDYSHGREVFFQLDFKISRYSNLYLRFRNKITERNSKDETLGIKEQVELNKINFRVHYDQRINSRITLKSRIEYVNFKYDDQVSTGFLMFQDIVYSFKEIPLKLYGRYALFDTDNYDSRIYAYENDLLYVFSIPSYYYKGIRTYIMAKYRFGKKVDLWVRWGMFAYQNVDDISSGLEQINGKRKSDFKIQLKIKI